MAKYAISVEGISELQKLQKDILSAQMELNASNEKLVSEISEEADNLGPYAKEILEMVRSVIISCKKSEPTIEYLTTIGIPQTIETITQLIGFDDVGGGDDSWPEPPVKVKVLRR